MIEQQAVTGAAPHLRHATAKGITLVYAQIVPVMAIVSLFPAIPRLFQQFGEVPHAALLVPMILTVPALFVALTAPFAGILADRFGRRRAFIWGMTLYVAAGLVPLATAQLPVIVGSRMVLGIAEAFVVTVSSALIGDYFREQRHKWVAQVGIWITIMGTVLLIVGGLLADISWRGPFMVYLAVIPGTIMAWIYIDEPTAAGSREINAPAGEQIAPYPWRAALLIGGVTLATSLIYYVEPLNFAAVLNLAGVKSASTIGLLQAGTTIGYMTGALAYRRLHRWPVARHLGVAGLFIGLGIGVIGLSTSLVPIALGAVLQQFGSGFIIPALLAWGQQLLPMSQRARGMGIWVTTFFTGTFLCPPMMSVVSALAGGLKAAFVAMALLSIVLSLIAFALAARKSDAPPPSPVGQPVLHDAN